MKNKILLLVLLLTPSVSLAETEKSNPVCKSYKECLPLAEKGNVEAQYQIGLAYRYGRIVLQDYDQAMSWFKKAFHGGSLNAYSGIGGLYYEGKGVQQDYETAFMWFKAAAEKGHRSSQNMLAIMYRRGWGVPQNNVEAYAWQSVAKKLGSLGADRIMRSIESELSEESLAKAKDQGEIYMKNYVEP